MFERDCNLKITVKILLEKYSEMTHEGAHLRSELKRWYNFWEGKLNNVSMEIQGASKTRKRVNGKSGFILEDPPDSIIEALNSADTNFFPNIRKLLILGATSPIGSTEAARATSGIRQLKTPYRSIYNDVSTTMSDIDKVSLRYLLESIPKKYLRNLYHSKINCC